MHRPLRTALALVGLTAAVYSTASLTGGWLGTPPWWTTKVSSTPVTVFGKTSNLTLEQLRDGRELISAAVILAGLVLLAAALWPPRLDAGSRPMRAPRTSPSGGTVPVV